MTVIVHDLHNSRSQRIPWLLEELGADHAIRHWSRDPETGLAPTAPDAVHPPGKAPMVETDGRVVIESGAIIEILHDRLGGTLRPARGTADGDAVTQWLHDAEGSAMLPLVLRRDAGLFGLRSRWPAIDAWVDRCHQRPAWQRALSKAGACSFA